MSEGPKAKIERLKAGSGRPKAGSGGPKPGAGGSNPGAEAQSQERRPKAGSERPNAGSGGPKPAARPKSGSKRQKPGATQNQTLENQFEIESKSTILKHMLLESLVHVHFSSPEDAKWGQFGLQ